MADLELIRRTVAEAARERERLAAQLAGTAAELASARARLTALQAAPDAEAIAEETARIRELVAQRAASAGAIGQLQDRLRADLDALLGDALQLEGRVPLVLLPVRIETRSTAGLASLRVRIFHDALHAE